MGTGALSQGVKRPGREAGHSPPTTAEVKKIWIYTSTPPYAFMAKREADYSSPSRTQVKNVWSYTSTVRCISIAWCLVKHRDNFTLTLFYVKNLSKTRFHVIIYKSPTCGIGKGRSNL
jgi:hypothetical protein